MRIDEVRATAFGPFRGEKLLLAPGMNVVHGPNEAGKSTWFAATFAGLAGRRKARGRGTAAAALFRNRHKPWTGSRWSAGVTVTLGDGQVLALEHDLAKGESRIVDGADGRVLSVGELESRLGLDLVTESSLDGTRLLGLNRDSARATVFTGQADVLRVLEDAEELQEFLERAATTEVADVTAEGALAWLVAERSERVGNDRVGKKPLRAREQDLLKARDLTSARRDRLGELTDAIVDERAAGERLGGTRLEVERADRMTAWVEIRALRDRLRRADALAAELAALPDPGADVDEEFVSTATMVLGAYTSGSDVPVLPEGPTADDLARELASLPPRPEGDLAPRGDILAARHALNGAEAALASHDAPEAPDEAVTHSTLQPDELRALADALEVPSPESTPGLATELFDLESAAAAAAEQHLLALEAFDGAVRRQREAQEIYATQVAEHDRLTADHQAAQVERATRQAETRRHAKTLADNARRRGFLVLGGGALLVVVGVVLAVLTLVVPGIAVAVLGLVAVGVGVVLGLRSPGGAEVASAEHVPPTPPAPAPPRQETFVAPVALLADPRVVDLRVRLQVETATRREHDERRAAARARIVTESLPIDAPALRALARTLDDAAGADERRQIAAQRQAHLREQRDQRATVLRALLGSTAEDRPLTEQVDTYVEACRERQTLAQQAARLPDLTVARDQRLQREKAHADAIAERRRQASEVSDVVRRLALVPPDDEIDVAGDATRLGEWLTQRQQARADQGERAALATRLDQLLESRLVDEWRDDLATALAAAGPEPTDLPDDVEAFRAAAADRHRASVDAAGVLRGRRDQLSQGFGSVAEAVEAEASAERALADVRSLAACLDGATAQLALAKERAHANIAPALEARVRPLLPRVTGGNYLDVMVDPATLKVRVTEATGAVREAELLSQGTMEQIFLLLRIALSQVLSGGDESAPIVLDDVTVQSDQDRTVAILTLLHELSADRQVVLFTQEQEVVEWALEALRGERDLVVDLAAIEALPA